MKGDNWTGHCDLDSTNRGSEAQEQKFPGQYSHEFPLLNSADSSESE